MVVLKKIKGSTLMETLVATVLIVIIFMLSSMILNNLFSNTIMNNTRNIGAQLNELHYLYINNKITLPYQIELIDWQIRIESFKENNQNIIEFEAIHSNSKKKVLKQYVEAN
jgi:hypothetical protein